MPLHPFAVALLVSSAACQSFLPAVRGSGLVMTEPRAVAGFDSIQVSGDAHVFLTQGDDEALDIECDDNLLPHILTTVDDGVLHIRFESGNWSPSERPVYRIAVRELNGIRLSGSTWLEANALHGDELDVHLSGSGIAEIAGFAAARSSLRASGSGQFHLGHVEVEDLEVRISGSGEVEALSGTIGRIDVRTSGSGDLNLMDVESQRANLELSGSGTAKLWVRDALTARVSGSGEIGYRGQPAVQSKISGSGEVYSIREEAN
ncbi:hypothetical protein Poly30_22850 [Planctomycetes bacterium Poly30]|uniref:Putative auto-transporter adhesin head GIN domain-containing protein n=1 Tax=Saltatorellus ferox TaxID=2528018 RepID=A0A518ERP9_9BACT|nr:hypothetical protein Poly30_22850 [Planctomycetes bacterium Poly30]